MLAEVTNAGGEMNTPCGGGAAVATTTSLSSTTVADASPAKRAAIAPFQRLALIVAMTPEGGIGKDGTMPWTGLRTDMRRFKELTVGGGNNAVVMGRKTWASIPAKFRPLPGRRNIVLSANPAARKAHGIPEGVEVVPDFAAVEKCLDGVDTCFIIGGGGVYTAALESGNCETIYATEIATAGIAADTFFKFDKAAFDCVSTSQPVGEKGLEYRFVEYKCKSAVAAAVPAISAAAPSIPAGVLAKAAAAPNHEENQYLDLIRKILAEGVTRGDRTGTGTISVFGAQMRFSLRDNVMPLLTTKRTFWRGLAEELVWFVSGSTNANELAAKNINIWNGNGSREFLDGRGLSHREVGDLGPVYGYQWRHFGAEYKDMHADYTGKGVDQLAEVIRTIKTNPESRRIIMSAWNPADLPAMALPPCHMFAQFYVANGELSCQMYQRSADMGLGVPFNIASYALLTRMIAHCCDLKPGEFVHTIGDAHVYLNHVEPLQRQLTRTPFPFPRLEITCATKNIDEIRFEDFKLEGYQCHKGIKMKMAV